MAFIRHVQNGLEHAAKGYGVRAWKYFWTNNFPLVIRLITPNQHRNGIRMLGVKKLLVELNGVTRLQTLIFFEPFRQRPV